MTALSAAKVLESKHTGDIKAFLMKASTTIYAGGLVMINSSGTAEPAAASAGNFGVVGVATETVTSAASGSYYIEVQEGLYKLTATTVAQTDVGEYAWAADDATVDDVAAVNLPIAGVFVEYVSASLAWVWVSWKLEKRKSYTTYHFSVDAADIADGDLITTMIPGFAGQIVKIAATTEKAVTTAAKGTTLNLEIGTTNLTGGVVTLAGTSALGEYTAGTAITAANVIVPASTVSLEASSTTTYIEGRFGIDVTFLVY